MIQTPQPTTLRTVRPIINTKVFLCFYDDVGKADLNNSYWNLNGKLNHPEMS